MIVSLFAFAAVGTASNRYQGSGPIKYEANALPIRRVLADISKLTGKHFDAANDIAKDHLILHVESASVQDVLDNIARVTFGEWVATGDTLSLRRDPKQVAENERAERAESLRFVERAMAIFRKNLDSQGTFDDTYARRLAAKYKACLQVPDDGARMDEKERIEQAAPLNRAIDRALLALAPDDIASIADGHRVVLSDTPTAAQVRLPDAAITALAAVVPEQRAWVDAIGLPDDNGRPRLGRITSLDALPIPSISHARLVLNRYDDSKQIEAELTLFDSSDNPLTHITEYITADHYPVDIAATKPSKAVVPQPTIVPLSPHARAAARILGAYAGDATPADREMLREALLNPTDVDPTSLVYGPCLIATAKAHNENLVALAQDQLLPTYFYVQGTGFNEEYFRANQDSNSDFLARSKDGWFTVRPKFLAQHLRSQADRAALQAAVRETAQTGAVTLERMSEYALHSPDEGSKFLFEKYIAGVDAAAGSQVLWNDWDYLRFYGSLSPEQRNNPRPQSCQSFDSTQLDLLGKVVYAEARLDVMHANSGVVINAAGDLRSSPMRQKRLQSMYSRDREPTEMLPDGLPRSTTVTLTTSAEPMFLVQLGKRRNQAIPAVLGSAAGIDPRPKGPNRRGGIVPSRDKAVRVHPGGIQHKSLAAERYCGMASRFDPVCQSR